MRASLLVLLLIAAAYGVVSFRTNSDICRSFADNCGGCVAIQSTNSPNQGNPACVMCKSSGGSSGDVYACVGPGECLDVTISDATECEADGQTDVCTQYTADGCDSCTAQSGCGWCGNEAEGTGSCISGSSSGPSVGVCPDEIGGWHFTSGLSCTVDYNIDVLNAGGLAFKVNGGAASGLQSFNIAPDQTYTFRIISTSSHPIQFVYPGDTEFGYVDTILPNEASSGIPEVIVGYAVITLPSYSDYVTATGETSFVIRCRVHTTQMRLTFNLIEPTVSSSAVESSSGSSEMSSSTSEMSSSADVQSSSGSEESSTSSPVVSSSAEMVSSSSSEMVSSSTSEVVSSSSSGVVSSTGSGDDYDFRISRDGCTDFGYALNGPSITTQNCSNPAPTLTLAAGMTYRIRIDSVSAHKVVIKTEPGASGTFSGSNGDANGVEVGYITLIIPATGVDSLVYYCITHAFYGEIHITGSSMSSSSQVIMSSSASMTDSSSTGDDLSSAPVSSSVNMVTVMFMSIASLVAAVWAKF